MEFSEVKKTALTRELRWVERPSPHQVQSAGSVPAWGAEGIGSMYPLPVPPQSINIYLGENLK